MSLSLESIRGCLEGGIPSTVVTCSADGIPNATYITQAHFVDPSHIALSFQFFSKTHQNVLVNPHAEVAVIHPVTAERYHMEVQYIRTETSGPLFESMKARLAGIASHVGMSKVFRLQGADIYRVLSITDVSRDQLPSTPARINVLSALRAVIEPVSRSTDLARLFDETLANLESHFDIRHSMIVIIHQTAGPERQPGSAFGVAEKAPCRALRLPANGTHGPGALSLERGSAAQS